MFDREILKNQLVLNEGLRLKPYTCTAGKRTIGVGRNFQDVKFTQQECLVLFGTTSISFHNANIVLDKGITKEQAFMLLDNDIDRCVKQLEKYPFWDSVSDSDERSRAIIDLCFNMGITTLLTFKNTLKYITDKNWHKAAENLIDSKWYHQVGDRSKRIVKLICPDFYEPKVTQKKVEVKVEPKVEPKITKKVEVKVEPKVEPKITKKVEGKVEPKVEPKITKKVEVKVEPKVEVKVEPLIKTDFESVLEAAIEESKTTHGELSEMTKLIINKKKTL